MSKPHGTVILCERENGATVAWEDERLSAMMPAGYFLEMWPRPWQEASKYPLVRKGTMGGGYLPGMHSDAGEAVRWCWQESKRERKAA